MSDQYWIDKEREREKKICWLINSHKLFPSSSPASPTLQISFQDEWQVGRYTAAEHQSKWWTVSLTQGHGYTRAAKLSILGNSHIDDINPLRPQGYLPEIQNKRDSINFQSYLIKIVELVVLSDLNSEIKYFYYWSGIKGLWRYYTYAPNFKML